MGKKKPKPPRKLEPNEVWVTDGEYGRILDLNRTHNWTALDKVRALVTFHPDHKGRDFRTVHREFTDKGWHRGDVNQVIKQLRNRGRRIVTVKFGGADIDLDITEGRRSLETARDRALLLVYYHPDFRGKSRDLRQIKRNMSFYSRELEEALRNANAELDEQERARRREFNELGPDEHIDLLRKHVDVFKGWSDEKIMDAIEQGVADEHLKKLKERYDRKEIDVKRKP